MPKEFLPLGTDTSRPIVAMCGRLLRVEADSAVQRNRPDHERSRKALTIKAAAPAKTAVAAFDVAKPAEYGSPCRVAPSSGASTASKCHPREYARNRLSIHR